MGIAKNLILENQLGQKVRTFSVNGDALNIVYLRAQRRVEAFPNLDDLEKNKIDYSLLKSISVSDLPKSGIKLAGLGAVRLADLSNIKSPIYTLPKATDDSQLNVILKKSSVGHVVVVLLLMLGSWLWTYLSAKNDPQIVTIVVPQQEAKIRKTENHPHVKVSQTKIKPTHQKIHQRVQTALKTKPHPALTAKAVDVQRVGALAALGGIQSGKRGYEGLDTKSMKAIRAAGTGRGGGGVGSAGHGGIKGYMPGNGLIAGSSGQGGHAQSAGGYGTRGVGGGKAGYGKIGLVGGTSSVSLPMDEEPTVQGGLDRDQIIAVINRHQGQIVYCYERGLQVSPQIGGRVAVDFVIGPNGKMTTAKVAQSSLGSRMVENCMLEKMRTWQFPHPVGKVNVDVLYPFELTRVSSR